MRRKLRIIGLLAVFAAILCCGAAAAERNGSMNGGAITWHQSDEGVLTFTGTGKLPDYAENSRIGNVSPFFEDTSVREVIIGEGITRVGSAVFPGCSRLEKVSLPDTLVTIGNSAFLQTGINGISLPLGLRSIETYAFAGTCLSDVVIPVTTKYIQSYAFYSCESLYEVTVLHADPVLGTGVFQGALPYFTLYGWGNSSAETYADQNSIEFEALIQSGSCGDGVRWSADPETGTLTVSGTGAMDDFDLLGAPWIESREMIYSAVIEDGVTNIGGYAFYNCKNLKYVSIPDSVKKIDEAAFDGCQRLPWMTIPDSVTRIGDYAFRYCENMSSIYLSKGLTDIGYAAFQGCKKLRDVTIPDSVTVIGNVAFQGTGLRSLTIPGSVTGIGGLAFGDCKDLLCVTIPDSVDVIGEIAFADCSSLETVSIFGFDTAIISGSFSGAPADMIMLGWTGSTAEIYAGENNIIFRSLQNPEFFLPDSLRTIGVEAFAGIIAKGVVIPKTVTWIEGNPFVDSMTEVIYGDPGSEAKVFADKFSYCFVAIDDAWMEKHRK